MKKPILRLYLTVLTLLLFFSSSSFATNYYVDPSSTSTTSNGSLASPWKTIAQVNSGTTLLNPGDTVFFKRGQTYSGRLTVVRSGIAGKPIVYTPYGTGALPEFNNAITDIIALTNRSYVVINGIKFIDNSISGPDPLHQIQAKISIAMLLYNSPHCTISNCDFSLVGIGIATYTGSDYTTITGNYMHNMRMVKNTPTTINNNDDYGANPMVLGSSYNTVNNNLFEECWALSYDYGYDGGAVELYGSSVNNNTIMYNTAINCNGFMEIGSGSGGVANNNVIAYNKIINCGLLGTFQNSGTFLISINNLQYLNNTVVETVRQQSSPSSLFYMAASTGPAGMVVVKNNIFWLSSGINFAGSKFNTTAMVHSNNIFRMSSGTLGVTLNSSELLSSTANLFTNTTGTAGIWNYSLLAGSPAINFGIPVGYTKDFIGNAIIGNPDVGILEFGSSTTTPLSGSSTAGTISCNGGNTTVTVSATGGTAPYTGTGNFTVTAGTYNYTVTDAKGLTATTSIILSQPSLMSATLTAGTIAINGGTTSITVAATGGTSPYSYNINGGVFQTANTFNNLLAGTYTIVVKDAKACTISKSITITQPVIVPLSATSTAGTISCNGGNTTVTVNATGGTAPYTGTGNFTVIAGTYNYTVTDAKGLTATTSIIVSQPSLMSATLTAGTIAINGGTTSITVAATGGTSPYSYNINGGVFQTANTFNNLLAGTYSIVVKDAKACTAAKSITITQPAIVPVSASSTAGTIFCNGGNTTVTVSATGGTAPYTGTGNFTVIAGTYNYTVTDAKGLTATTSIIVGQPSLMNVTITAGTIAINGGITSVTVAAAGATSPYSYNINGGVFQTSNTFNNVLAGTYTILVKDANACTISKSITITQPAIVPLSASSTAGTISCNGGNTTVTVSASGGTAPYTGTGNFTVIAGTYNYTVTDAKGLTATTSIIVSQPSLMSATTTAGTIAINGGTTSVTVAAVGATSPYSYNINGGVFQTSNTFNNVLAGTYTILVKDANACTISKSITITQPAIVPLSANSTAGTISCNGGNTTVTVSATGGTAPYTGTGNFTVIAGTYNYTVTDAKGLAATTSIIVGQPSLMNVTITAGTIAINGGTTSVTVAAAGGTSPYSYNINGGVFQTSNTFNNLLAGTYSIVVKDANACAVAKSITITQPAIVPLSANSTAGNISCNGGNTTVTVSATGGTAPYTGTGNFTVTTGTYNYTVTDAKGLTATTSIIVSQPSIISASLTAGTIAINGGSTSVTVAAAGGTSPYSYNINGGVFQTSNTFNNLVAGTYSIVVKDVKACTISKTITITQPAIVPLSASSTAGTISCNGGNTTVTVSATGGTAPYTGTGNFTVTAGTYNYTVTDAKGLTATTSIILSQPSLMSATLTAGTIAINGGTTSVTVTAAGATSPYSYNINGGVFQTSNTFNNVLAGTYSIVVKDAKGCNISKSITITQPESASTRDRFKIRVYPNPSTNYFTLNIRYHHGGTEKVQLIVRDVKGSIVYTASGNIDTQFKFGCNFIPGTYFGNVYIAGTKNYIKLIKTN